MVEICVLFLLSRRERRNTQTKNICEMVEICVRFKVLRLSALSAKTKCKNAKMQKCKNPCHFVSKDAKLEPTATYSRLVFTAGNGDERASMRKVEAK